MSLCTPNALIVELFILMREAVVNHIISVVTVVSYGRGTNT